MLSYFLMRSIRTYYYSPKTIAGKILVKVNITWIKIFTRMIITFSNINTRATIN